MYRPTPNYWRLPKKIGTHNVEKRCHSGFLKHAQECTEEDQNKIFSQTQPKRILVCGHSLGGAAAILFTLEYALKKFDESIVHCVTFGAPLAINDGYVSQLQNKYQDIFQNYVMEYDPIPILPRCYTVCFNLLPSWISKYRHFHCNYMPFGNYTILKKNSTIEYKNPDYMALLPAQCTLLDVLWTNISTLNPHEEVVVFGKPVMGISVPEDVFEADKIKGKSIKKVSVEAHSLEKYEASLKDFFYWCLSIVI